MIPSSRSPICSVAALFLVFLGGAAPKAAAAVPSVRPGAEEPPGAEPRYALLLVDDSGEIFLRELDAALQLLPSSLDLGRAANCAWNGGRLCLQLHDAAGQTVLRVLSKGLQPLAADTPVDLFVQSTSGVGRLLLDPAGDRIVLPGLVTEPSRDSLELSNIVLGRIFRLPAASELSPTRPLDPAGDLVQLPRHNLTWLGLTADGSYVSTAYHGRVFLTATERARDDAELDLFEGNMKHITGAAWADPGHLLLLVDDGTLYGITETSWTTTSEHLPIAEGTHAFRLFTSSVSGETLRYVGCGSDYDQLSSVRVYDSTGVLRDVVASPTGRDEFTVGSGGDVVFWNFVEGFVSAGGRTLYVTEVGNPVAVLSLD